jgi:hypothetical protein
MEKKAEIKGLLPMASDAGRTNVEKGERKEKGRGDASTFENCSRMILYELRLLVPGDLVSLGVKGVTESGGARSFQALGAN